MASPRRTSAELPPEGVEWDDGTSEPPPDVEWDDGTVGVEPVREDWSDAGARGAGQDMPPAPPAPPRAMAPQTAPSTQRPSPPDRSLTQRLLDAVTQNAGPAVGLGAAPLALGARAMGVDPSDALRMYLQGTSRGFMDEATGLVESGEVSGPEYEVARNSERAAQNVAAQQMGGGTAFALEAAGGMLGPRFVRRPGAGAAAEGAIAGAGAAETLADVPMMLTAGGALGFGAKQLGDAAGDVARRVLGSPLIQESPAARYLRSKGVRGLTVGQMAPNSPFAQIEEVSTSVGGFGPSIKGQREAAQRQWQDVVLNAARPPGGASTSPDAALPDRLASMYDDFGGAYAPVHGVKMTPVTSAGIPLRSSGGQPGAFDSVVGDPSVLATADQRKIAQEFLNNELSILPAHVGSVDSSALLAMRSNIRTTARDALKNQDFTMAQLLGNAEDVVTDAIEHQLPPDAMGALRAADSAYARYKTVEKAVANSGDQVSGLTPAQLSAAVKSSMESGAYARGGGGELRDLARAGRETLDARVPVTGARLLASGPAQWVTAPAAYAMNLPGPKRFMLGETVLQRGVVAGSEYAGQAGASGARAYADQRGTEDSEDLRSLRPRPTEISESELVQRIARENPEALGAYATPIQESMAKGTFAITHHVLQQRDPAYRQLLEQARKAQQ